MGTMFVVDRHKSRIEDGLGLKLLRLLGSGGNGSVYLTEKGVVKLTFDPSEARSALFKLEGKITSDIIPTYYGAWEFMDGDYKFYLIHREELSDYPFINRDTWDYAFRSIDNAIWQNRNYEEAFALNRVEIAHGDSEAYDRAEYEMLNIYRSMNVIFTDLYYLNWGSRDGQVVIRDVCSDSKPLKVITTFPRFDDRR